jgi:hypothetical protein
MRVVTEEAYGEGVPFEQPCLVELDHAGDVAGYTVPVVLVFIDFQNDHLPIEYDDEVETREGLLDAAETDIVLPLEFDARPFQELCYPFLLALAALLSLGTVIGVFVSPQGRRLDESFPAVLTLVRLLASMCAMMVSQSGCKSTRSTAHPASVWAIARMCLLVCTQLMLKHEICSTDCAREGALPGVRALVAPQRARTSKCSFAIQASMWALAPVCLFVSLESVCTGKSRSAYRAGIGTLPGVGTLVGFQSRRLGKGCFAILALVGALTRVYSLVCL